MTKNRSDTRRFGEAGADHRCTYQLCVVSRSDGLRKGTVQIDERYLSKRARRRSQQPKVRHRKLGLVLGTLRPDRPHDHNPIGVAHWQWAQEGAFYNAEDTDADADPRAERHDHNARVGRAAPQSPKGVLQISQAITEHGGLLCGLGLSTNHAASDASCQGACLFPARRPPSMADRAL